MTECRARDPHTCRYHGSEQRSYQEQVEATYRNLVSDIEHSSDMEEKYLLQQELRNIEVEFAATESGQEELTAELERTDDAVERERLQRVLTEGERYRERIEEKTNGVVVFPASKLEEAEKRIAKANRKLERAGVTERFTYEVEEFVETDNEDQNYRMIRLTLNRPSLKANGWNFVASLDQTEDGSFVTRVLPGQELEGYRPEQFVCDHCGSHRRRNSTYLLQGEGGDYKQVGSNCLKSFLGVNPQLWALQYDLEDNNSYIDRGERTWGSADSLLNTKSVVAAALALSNDGESFISSARARERGTDSTSSQVRGYFFSRNRDLYENFNHHDYMTRAEEMISGTDFSGDDDYSTNMRVLLAQEHIAPRHLGYVTSVISAYNRAHREPREAATRAVGYIGQAGERIEYIPVKVKKLVRNVNTFNGRDVDTTMMIFTDNLGRELKWNASGWKDYKEGDEFVIKSATVKELSEFNGNEQTVITRARILDT